MSNNQNENQRFNINLKRLRKAKKLSQEQLAEKIGVTQAAVQRWESGERTPHMKDISQITKALECKTEDLFGLTSDKIIVPLIGYIPAPAPMNRNAQLQTSNPHSIVVYDHSGDLCAFIIKDASMNKAGLEGHALIVDLADNDKTKLNGAKVLAEANGEIVFRRYLSSPDRLECESTLPLPPYTGEFTILGRAIGVQHEFF
jgi:transcriptional regulator with XRE-family HTH domain